MSTDEWDALEWWEQRNHIEGFVAEGILEAGPKENPEGMPEIAHRTADTGAGVIDLAQMRAALGGR